MDPSVSVPSDTAAIFAATDIADPLLDPHGSADATYGFCMKSIKFQESNVETTKTYIISELYTLWSYQNSLSISIIN